MADEKTMYLIKHLPLELREKIYKEFVKKTIKEKLDMGFDIIHFEIKNAPYCSKKERITKVFMCNECFKTDFDDFCFECSFYRDHYLKSLCTLCFKKGERHYIQWKYPNTDFFKFI